MSTAQNLQAWPIPYGPGAPFAGQVFFFGAGGIMTTGTASTLLLTLRYGSTVAAGVSLAASAAQTYVASLTNAPWRLQGEIVFRTASQVATSSTVWAGLTFTSQGTLATAGSGLTIVANSTAAVSVDSSGTAAANSFGALCVSATFGVASTITTEYTYMIASN